MKKIVISLGIIILFIIGGLFALKNINFNRIGTEAYYTEIVGTGELEENRASDGTIYTRYVYELPAYSEEGKEQVLTFTAGDQLRETAYLRLYIKGDKDVTSYQEVEEEEIPEKAATQLQ